MLAKSRFNDSSDFQPRNVTQSQSGRQRRLIYAEQRLRQGVSQQLSCFYAIQGIALFIIIRLDVD